MTVRAREIVRELGQLAGKLNANQSRPDGDKGQQPPLARRIGFHLRLLEEIDDVIAQENRIRKRLERKRVLRARDPPCVGHATQRDDEMVICQRVNFIRRRVPRVDDLRSKVDPLHVRLDELRFLQQRANRRHRVPRLEHARARFEQQRRHQEIVVAVHQRDVDGRVLAK